jgi:hypothetical protein
VWALLELCVRLMAGYLFMPLGLLLLLSVYRFEKNRTVRVHYRRLGALIGMTMICSMLILTDSMYVSEFGVMPCLIMYLSNLVLWIRICQQYSLHGTRQLVWAVVGATIFWCFDRKHGLHFGEPIEVDRQVQEGLYYDASNPIVNLTVQNWSPIRTRTITRHRGCLQVTRARACHLS